jgi:hypothetical protein
MRNKYCYNQWARVQAIRVALLLIAGASLLTFASPRALAGDAPSWMHALVNAPLPRHDDRTDAVLLYSERNVNVISADKIKIVERRAYKILRPDGRDRGVAVVYLTSNRKINNLHGWCIPAQGKDFEVKEKDAIEVSPPKVEGGELVKDIRARVLNVPAPDPGNIVGYEYETEERPLLLEGIWHVQGEDPVQQARYSLQLPAGWEFKSAWLNYPEVKPSQTGSNQWQWTVSDVKGVREERDMPPLQGLTGQMIVSFIPPGGAGSKGFSSWQQMGTWYRNLTADRLTASPEIKQQVASLASTQTSQVAKMRAIADFVQHQVRYVAIELGIGGWQPHAAAEVFGNRYGDCKDKATLMSVMLREIGVESYYVVINTERGSITADTPAYSGFDHVILAIKLPDSVKDSSLVATAVHPSLGRLLFFDPTSELHPFGEIGGYLQANWGLLVTPEGGELVEIPKEPAAMNSIRRVAHLTLDLNGNLQGEVQETRLGDRASSERWALRSVTRDQDRIKPIETLLAGSLSNFQITHATVLNLQHTDQPFGFNYTFQAASYAKRAGDLLLLRPRVLGQKSRGILETKEPRQFPIEFESPVLDTDTFEIALPAGYVVDDVPPPVDADFSFASYHSKTEVKGNVIAYTRTFEVKELSVPLNKADELKKFYRIIASDERNTAVLKPAR